MTLRSLKNNKLWLLLIVIIYASALSIMYISQSKDTDIVFPENSMVTIDKEFSGHIVSGAWENNVNPPRRFVSITPLHDRQFFLCDYGRIVLSTLDNSGKLSSAKIIDPPSQVSNWNPTGLYYYSESDTLFVANYNGHNILELKYDESSGRFTYIREITDPLLKSPENIYVKNGNIAIADYDGSRIFLFNINGELLWSAELSQAHGVAISDKYVFATSLGERKIVKYDLSGREITSAGKIGWGDNEYLWPTSIDVLDNEYVLVSDAHRGQLTLLDADLNYRASLGSNGPGVASFNYPYSAIFYDDNIYVTDTGKSRVIVLNYEGTATNQFSFSDSLVSGKESIPVTATSPYDYSFVSYRFGEVPSNFINPLNDNNESLVAGYNSIDFLSKSDQITSELEVLSPGLPGDILDSYFYVTWVKKQEQDGKTYYIFGSPQSKNLIIYNKSDRVFSVNKNHYDLVDMWTYNNLTYAPDGSKMDHSSIIEEENVNFEKFIDAVKSGTSRRTAFHQTYLSSLSNTEFDEWINHVIVTNEGKTYLNETQNGIDQAEAAEKYFVAMKDQPVQYLFEQLLINTLNDSNLNPRIEETSSAIVTEEKTPYPGYEISQSYDEDANTYTSYIENNNPGKFQLTWEKPFIASDILIEWINKENVGIDYEIIGTTTDNKEIQLYSIEDNEDLVNNIKLENKEAIKKITFVFNKGAGQNRLLLRTFKVYGVENNVLSR